MPSVRDQLVIKLNRGSSKSESFQSICQALSEYADVDRVCLLEMNANAFHLAATSNGKCIDRRTRLSRSMQAFVSSAVDAKTLTCDSPFSFVVGSGTPIPDPMSKSFHRFLSESGSRLVVLKRYDLAGRSEQDLVASLPNSIVILMERFDARDRMDVVSEIDQIQSLVEASLINASERKATWTDSFLERIRRTSFWKRAASIVALCFIGIALLVLIPVEFWLPAEGQIVPSVRRTVFAPADGIVLELPVRNGSTVRQGETIAIIRSRDLDLKQQQIENEIAAARANLDSLIRSRGSTSNRVDSSVSSTEQVLKAQLEGLAQQAEFLKQQQQALVVKSPISGQIDHWNMQQNLSSRPIARGQFLADVISDADGWVLQIELDDRHSGYVKPMSLNPQYPVRFSLPSQPGEQYEAVLDQMDNTVEQNGLGKWVVRARANLPIDSFDWQSSIRSGASADVKVLAGTRSIGFVWFRGLIEWFRTKV